MMFQFEIANKICVLPYVFTEQYVLILTIVLKVLEKIINIYLYK